MFDSVDTLDGRILVFSFLYLLCAVTKQDPVLLPMPHAQLVLVRSATLGHHFRQRVTSALKGSALLQNSAHGNFFLHEKCVQVQHLSHQHYDMDSVWYVQ
jgi:hypothetical protein